LQVLEEGRLTDSFGRKVDFRNTIIIMTANIGAELLRKQGSLGFAVKDEGMDYETMKSKLLEEVKKTFKPEFLNRLDDIIVFRPLSKEDLRKIVLIEVSEVEKRLKEHNIKLIMDQSAIELLISRGFDQAFGARPLKRIIQRFLEDPLAEEMISGKIKEGSTIKAFQKGDYLSFE